MPGFSGVTEVLVSLKEFLRGTVSVTSALLLLRSRVLVTVGTVCLKCDLTLVRTMSLSDTVIINA